MRNFPDYFVNKVCSIEGQDEITLEVHNLPIKLTHTVEEWVSSEPVTIKVKTADLISIMDDLADNEEWTRAEGAGRLMRLMWQNGFEEPEGDMPSKLRLCDGVRMADTEVSIDHEEFDRDPFETRWEIKSVKDAELVAREKALQEERHALKMRLQEIEKALGECFSEEA
jgi:hypothetical protein